MNKSNILMPCFFNECFQHRFQEKIKSIFLSEIVVFCVDVRHILNNGGSQCFFEERKI